MKKTFWAVLTIAMVSFMSMGCFTTGMWQNKSAFQEEKISYYDDTITAFMMTQEGSKIIFVSQKYHYILDSDPTLVYLLRHKDELPVQYDFDHGHYVIDINNNNILATFEGSLDKTSLNAQTTGELEAYHPRKDGKIFLFNFKLGGIRYLSDAKINDKITQLHHPITLHFSEVLPQTTGGKVTQVAKKIAMTPITLVGDAAGTVLGGAILAVGVVLLPLSAIFNAIDQAKKSKTAK